MKNKLLIVITIMAVLLWTIVPGVYADSIDLEDVYAEDMDEDSEDIEDSYSYEDEDEDEDEDEGEDEDENQINPWEEIKNELESEKEKIEIQKEILEDQKDALEDQKYILEQQYEIALKSGNSELAHLLLEQIDLVKQDIELKEQLIKQKKDEMKAIIKSLYTVEELEKLAELSGKLMETNKDIIVLPIDSILIEGSIIKFDTPPIIKDETLFVSVNTLSECLGVDVNWNPEKQNIVIMNETTQIILPLNKNFAYVNGIEVLIDAAAETINNTTFVPFRFIAEALGAEVKWDSETEAIEIQNGQAKIIKN